VLQAGDDRSAESGSLVAIDGGTMPEEHKEEQKDEASGYPQAMGSGGDPG